MADPARPLWPATKIRLPLSMRRTANDHAMAGSGQGLFLAGQLEIVVHHEPHQFLEAYPRFPAKQALHFGSIAHQIIDLGRAEVARVGFDMPGPIEAAVGAGQVEEFADGMGFAGGNDIIVGRVSCSIIHMAAT